MPAAIFVEKSNNYKIKGYKGGRVSTTYASIKGSCPQSCELRQTEECYGMLGRVGFVNQRLDGDVSRSQPIKTAREEAAAIDASFRGGPVPQDGARGGRDVRLHTVGDAIKPKAARILADAIARLIERGANACWTYTHGWKEGVRRKDWGPVSVLASLDFLHEAPKARKMGYALARYVPLFPNGKRAWLEGGTTWIPCPAQTRKDVGCADCRLCFDDKALRKRNMGIAFVAHGTREKAMKRRLTVLMEAA